MTKIIKNEMVKERLIEMAREKHGEIQPMHNWPEFDDRSYQEYPDGNGGTYVLFYYNVGKYTHNQRLPVEN